MATINMPLICWKCLSKDVFVDGDNNVICREKDCGFHVTQTEWFDLAKGSLPDTGEHWVINVTLPKTARDA